MPVDGLAVMIVVAVESVAVIVVIVVTVGVVDLVAESGIVPAAVLLMAAVGVEAVG